MNVKNESYIQYKDKSLGSVTFNEQDFPQDVYKEIDCSAFKKLSVFDKHQKVNQVLFDLLESADINSFLLPHVVTFISRVRESLSTYNLGSFEFWLNHFSGVSDEHQLIIRAKIVGKHLPRSVYQKMFPLGLGDRYPGPHFSLAHYATDLDTTVASFHCFMAAFGSRIAESRHHWVVPGGPPQGSIEIDFVFKQALGADVFKALSQQDKLIQISSLDLLTQDNIEKKTLQELSYDVDHARSKKAVILVEDNGCYLGDWRHMDVDPVRAIISRFWNMMIEHQNAFHIGLISLFAKKELKESDLKHFTEQVLGKRLADCNCSGEFASEHRVLLDKFLRDVVGVEQGFQCTYGELVSRLEEMHDFIELKKELVSLSDRPFFDDKGHVVGDRGLIFGELEKVIANQKEEYKNLLRYFDTLKVAHEIKRKVLGLAPTYITHSAELDQIQKMMGDYSHLTVTYKEGDHQYPLGVVHATDLKRKAIATASWNDFSNPKEADSRREIEVISYIDHHKSEVRTMKPATGIVMDAQSSNSIYANLLFEINDRFSTGGMTLEEIEKQIEEVKGELTFPSHVRILQRLLVRKDALSQNKQTTYCVTKEKETLEYLQCVFAILDDTDLLTKVTAYDVETMCSLVNRLKSLMLGKEVEVVNFDDIPRNKDGFVKAAAKKLLQTKDLYSLYSIIYKAKEEAIEELVQLTARGSETPFFQDTKILNEHACIGQFKHFIQNAATVSKKNHDLVKIWINRAHAAKKENNELKLFMFMMSTISSADELFSDKIENPDYHDELWFYLPNEEKRSEAYLKKFLVSFAHSSPLAREQISFEVSAKRKDLEEICKDAFSRPIDINHHKLDPNFICLKVPQKKLVSRKAQIAPNL